MRQPLSRALYGVLLCTLAAGAAPRAAHAFDGGLYVANRQFTFDQAVTQGLRENRGRFFVLTLPPATVALLPGADARTTELRTRALQAGAVFLVCERDVAMGTAPLGSMVKGVTAVRGWPPAGSASLGPNQNFFAGENPALLPASMPLLRRVRGICSE